MKVINTRTHGVLDYLVGALLMLAPFLFGFNTGGPEQWVPITLGAGAILYSLLTNYELGLFKLIPFRVHLTLDMLSGIFLAASPWLLGYADQVWVPHVLVGLFEIGASFMTHTSPSATAHTPHHPVRQH
jgi:hypothetical protein